MQRKQRRPSSQHSRSCSAAPITRSASPSWVRELFAHVMHENALGNAEEDFNARTPVGTNSERAGYYGSKSVAQKKKTNYGHNDAGISAPANLLCATIASQPQRPRFPTVPLGMPRDCACLQARSRMTVNRRGAQEASRMLSQPFLATCVAAVTATTVKLVQTSTPRTDTIPH